jgi:drug/metabolite transporter (DMT)-like permease
MTPRATFLLFAVGTVWGASFLFIRVAIDEVQPLQIVFVRTLTGALVMLVFLRTSRMPVAIPRGTLGQAALLSVLAILLPFFLISWGEREIESGTAAVINATMPLFTLLFAAALLEEEELTASRIAGVLLGLAGVVLLVGGHVDNSASALALAAMVLASASYGLAAVGARFLIRRVHPLLLSTIEVASAALYAGVIFFATGDPRVHITLEAWLAMLVLGALGTGAAYVAYYTLIEMVSSVRASFVAYIIPVVGVILGAVVLGEPVSWFTLAGGCVILAGVATGTGTLNRFVRHSGLAPRRLRS